MLNHRHAIVCALACSVLLAGCSKKANHSSPQKVAESFRAAMEKKDWSTAFACMTTESQDMLLGFIVLASTFSTIRDKKKQESLEGVFKKHGISKEGGKDALKNVKDKGAFFGDLVAWNEEHNPSKKGKGPENMADSFANTEFSNFKIDGDTATADVTVKGEKKSSQARFVKIDGKWYLDLKPQKKSKSE